MDYSIDETAKQKLFDRLFKEHKVRDYASISQQGRHMLGTACVDKLPKATIDPVKEKVRAADAEVDLMLLELIR